MTLIEIKEEETMKQTHTTKTTAIILTVMDGEYEVFEDLSIERYNLFDGQPCYPPNYEVERNEDITQEDINKLFSLVREGVTDSTDPRVTETKIYKEFQRVERFSVVKRYRPKNREIDNNDNLSTKEIIHILSLVVDLVIDIILRSPYLRIVKIENLYECLYERSRRSFLNLSVFERLASSSNLIYLRLKFDNSISFEKEEIQSFIEILSKSQSLQRLDLTIFNRNHYQKNSHFQQKLFFSKKEMLLFAESLTKFPNLQEVDLRESRFTPSRIKAMKDLITEKAPNLNVFF
jgi:hypothetical protein